LHLVLLGLVKDLLQWQVKYLKGRYLKHQFDNRFSSVPRYAGLHLFCKPFDSMKYSTLPVKEIWGIIRTLAVHWAPIVDSCHDGGNTAAVTDYDEMLMGAVRALRQFSLHVSKENHCDLFRGAPDD
jgi:hypothetical protein